MKVHYAVLCCLEYHRANSAGSSRTTIFTRPPVKAAPAHGRLRFGGPGSILTISRSAAEKKTTLQPELTGI